MVVFSAALHLVLTHTFSDATEACCMFKYAFVIVMVDGYSWLLFRPSSQCTRCRVPRDKNKGHVVKSGKSVVRALSLSLGRALYGADYDALYLFLLLSFLPSSQVSPLFSSFRSPICDEYVSSRSYHRWILTFCLHRQGRAEKQISARAKRQKEGGG